MNLCTMIFILNIIMLADISLKGEAKSTYFSKWSTFSKLKLKYGNTFNQTSSCSQAMKSYCKSVKTSFLLYLIDVVPRESICLLIMSNCKQTYGRLLRLYHG